MTSSSGSNLIVDVFYGGVFLKNPLTYSTGVVKTIHHVDFGNMEFNDLVEFIEKRAKVQWLREGDSNTRFFHNVVRERRHANQVRSVSISDGNFVYDEDVPYAFIEHLKGYLGTSDASLEPLAPIGLFQNTLTLSDALFMIRPILDSEIRDAMFQIGKDKAPDSDGFTSHFFKAAWEVVGKDVTVAIHNFFYRGRLAKELNHTLICLLPKVPNATSVSDFRPISCCSALYKCISKVIVNRIKPFLDGLVDHAQSAFIPGRRIVDNILMAHELVVGYHLNIGKPRCAFKIDLRKAYDMVDWRFLLVMMEGFGFHPVLVSWIREMLSTTTYSVVVNGESWGHFHGKRGIRQGDPLSPYLFTLVMEGFAMIFKQCIAEVSQFEHHPGCADIDLTHLCFADDLFVFTGGDVASVEVLKKALFLFEKRSGLSPNLAKSDVFFGNVVDSEKDAILSCLPFRLGAFPIRYLGVPLSPIFLKVSDYGGLITRVKQRVQNWKMKALSFGGRRQLVISVLQSLQLYWMAIFVFPSSVLHELEGILRSFLWAQGQPVQAKNMWDILTSRPTLWVSWVRGLNIHSSNFWIVRKTNAWSRVLRKMMDLRSAIRPHVISRIGDGRTTHAWEDTWLQCGPLVSMITYRHIHRSGFNTSTTVRDFLDHIDGAWPADWLDRWPNLVLSTLPVTVDDTSDTVLWQSRNNGMVAFTVSMAYESLDSVHAMVPWTTSVWFPGHIPKHAFCLWLACHNRLPTQDRLILWKQEPPDWKCSLCGSCLDSHQHLFFECTYAAFVWAKVRDAIGWMDGPQSWSGIMDTLSGEAPPRKFIHKIGLVASVYMVWKERNKRLFTTERRPESVCARDTLEGLGVELVVICLLAFFFAYKIAWKKFLSKKNMTTNDIDVQSSDDSYQSRKEEDEVSNSISSDHEDNHIMIEQGIKLNDPFLSLLCYDNIDGGDVEEDVNSAKDWSVNNIDDDSDGVEEFIERDVVYPNYDPSINWKLTKPVLGMKIESPAQLKESMIDYGVANGYQLEFPINDHMILLVRCGKQETNPEEDEGIEKTTNKKRRKCMFKLWASIITTAMGRDANNQIFPLAWVVVSVENKENWKWFVNLLSEDLGMKEGFRPTIISDQHKGILEAVKDIFPYAEHRQCTRHIYANFKKKFRGVIPSDYNQFEARNEHTALVVDINEHGCSCRSWQLSGIPCILAIAALAFLNKDPEIYVNNWLKKDMLKEAYKYPIKPLNGSSLWPKTDDIKPLPPKERRMPSRPTIKRKRDACEKEIKHSKVRIGRKMTCQNCQEKGHNIKSFNKANERPTTEGSEAER
ncbi:hypothetical protein OSB04_026397 [Centaurea solstitialis]|uniref:Reverse transcriptase domain-containing protein n=1 Tax=Centaurea solstitialis TaxID=347529 RepID=A0AA38SNW9_9ASTR|nr:hypothetical protein OSB04_026397 [Centaurea solstitialis]